MPADRDAVGVLAVRDEHGDVSDDPPTDVVTVLGQLLSATRTAIAEGDSETAGETITSAQTVATNKLPEGERRAALLHGCDRVRALLEAGTSDDRDAAAEYIAAMERRLPED
jgi:hypothetical protein